MTVESITSRDNALLVRVRKLARTPGAYRREGTLWLEGEHLCEAWRERGGGAAHALIAESAWQQPALRALAQAAGRVARMPDTLFAI